MKNERFNTDKLTRIALLTAVVVLLQSLATVLKIGELSINLTLVPVVIGAVLYGSAVGTWLGLAAAVTILVSGQATFFFGLNIVGTILVVLVKGALSGFLAGFFAAKIAEKHPVAAVFTAAAVAPIVNTAVFLVGCRLFFYDGFVVGAAQAGGISPILYLFVGLAGVNFLVELVINLVLAPTVVRLLPILGARMFRK